jgi:hypothetical protein
MVKSYIFDLVYFFWTEGRCEPWNNEIYIYRRVADIYVYIYYVL